MVKGDPGGDRGGGAPKPCARCGAPLVLSHRQYAGRGASADVLRCRGCGTTVTRAPRDDGDRPARATGRSKRHVPVDEGPPSNPVIDAELARRLLEDLGG